MTLPTAQKITVFQKQVYAHYAMARREMPWRTDTRSYYVLVSELMLQQTQVERVKPKFEKFIARFPDMQTLANTPLSSVLEVWLGLGYNRRARFLQAAAREVCEVFGGELPADAKLLRTLPGVGPNTAGAIMAYAFNKPAVFVETNIRTVYIHHFFHDDTTKVSDKDIAALLEVTMDVSNPRRWYWALMDYGTFLKAKHGNNIARSQHYKKQSTFHGSSRQMRGEIVRRLSGGAIRMEVLRHSLGNDERFGIALAGLIRDDLVERLDDIVALKNM